MELSKFELIKSDDRYAGCASAFKLKMIINKSLCSFVVVILMAGCASTPPPEVAPGTLKVNYSLRYPDGSLLKEFPKEVKFVRTADTQRNVAGQVVLNVLMLAAGGGFATKGFSKEDMKGAEIVGIDNRDNIKNQIPSTFMQNIRSKVSAYFVEHPDLQAKSFKNPLVVAGGGVRLIYESLTGEEADLYRLNADMVIYKQKENGKLFSDPNVYVSCDKQSKNMFSEKQWSENSYELVRVEMEKLMAACESNIVAAMPDLLKN